MGRMMALIANVLLVGATYYYSTVILPLMVWDADTPQIVRQFHATATAFFFINSIFNFWACNMTNPGEPQPPPKGVLFVAPQDGTYFDIGTVSHRCRAILSPRLGAL